MGEPASMRLLREMMAARADHEAAANDDSDRSGSSESELDVDERENVRAYWEKIGLSSPYWGVLTDSKYAGRALDDSTSSEFWGSGAGEVELLEGLLQDVAAVCLSELQAVGSFLELGCGVGRIALHMARRCTR